MKMICRSLTVLRMELQNNRVATADGGMRASVHDMLELSPTAPPQRRLQIASDHWSTE